MFLFQKIDEPKKSSTTPALQEQKNQAEKKEKEPEKKQEEKKQELEKAFFYINSSNNLKEFTFITCNPLQIYGQAKPRIARVSYKLQEKEKGSYSLMRKESSSIIFGTEKDSVEYEVISDIKELSFEFIIPVPGKEKTDFKSLKEWRSTQNIEKQKMFIPQFVKVNLILWDNYVHANEQAFEFRFSIYTFVDHLTRKEETKSEQAKEPEKAPELAKTNTPTKPNIPGLANAKK